MVKVKHRSRHNVRILGVIMIMNHNMHLAPELIDLILDNLHKRLRDVRHCSLVCRAWLHKCRSLLFRRKVLYPREGYSRSALPYNNKLYPALLTSPHIADYIKELKVYEGQEVKDEQWIKEDKTLPLLLRKLRKLERIEFKRLEWDTLPVELKDSVCSVLELPTLASLEIQIGHFAGMDDFADFLSHARSLTGLTLNAVSTPVDNSDNKREELAVEEPAFQDPLQQSRHLVDLRIASFAQNQLLAWFLGPQSPFALSRIHTLHVARGSRGTVNTLLRRIGASLKRLEIDRSAHFWCK
jgi:hypothetical protein